MNRVRIFLILCLSLFCCIQTFSQSPSAEQLALQFLSQKQSRTGQKNGTGFDKIVKHGSIWIFEKNNPQSFVLVKDSDPPYVIGYSLDNLFLPHDTLDSPVAMILENLEAASHRYLPDNLHKSTFIPVEPMIQTRWGQDDFFNFFCPQNELAGNGHVMVGCVAVAMGQILRYYGKFNKFSFQVMYENPQYGPLNATMGNFQWAKMEDVPVTIDLETSRLLYALGVLTHMSYGPSVSTSSDYMAYNGFKKLNYLDAKIMERSTTDSLVWKGNFYSNLADSKPIYVMGSGHAFVCDGMDANGLLHLNLGWYGYADGYYSTDLYTDFSIRAAICDLSPYSGLLPPVNLTGKADGDYYQFSWSSNPRAPEPPTAYRVYLNDTLFFPTTQTTISSQNFPPGNHAVRVSSVYSSQESRWIGPIFITVKGDKIQFEDPQLQQLIEAEYNKQFTPPTSGLTSDQALLIKRITIPDPVISLKGIEACKNIQSLIINGTGQELDFSPVRSLAKLKSLTINNIKPLNIELVAKNHQLYELFIDNSPLPNLSWLSNSTDLVTLSVKNVNLSSTLIYLNFDLLESLTIYDCQISRTGFLGPQPRLTLLNLSENKISEINWTDTLSYLREINLAGNQISDVGFLEKSPSVKNLDLSRNQLTQFVSGCFFKELTSLDLSSNQMDSISFAEPVISLRDLNLQSNHFSNVSGFRNYMPNLVNLNLAKNQLTQLWNGCMQSLKSLNISDNRITHLIKIPDHPSLTHLECRSNRITDVYPLIYKEFYFQLTHLDITGNPISTEAMEKYIPRMNAQIDTLHLPEKAEPMSPGYPVPARNQTLSDQAITLSWTDSGITDPGFYEVWMGDTPDSMTLLENHLSQPTFTVDLDSGRNYYWLVNTVTPDTSFVSGIFDFRTYKPIALPYNETFEFRDLSSYISDLSNGWIVPRNDSTELRDGKIIDAICYEGEQSMSLLTRSGLQLPLKHLVQKTLRIRMFMHLDDDSRGCVELLDINGTDLQLFFKPGGRCDIYFNRLFYNQINFPADLWFPVTLTAYGTSGNLQIKIGNDSYNFPWLFPNGNVCIGELDLSCLSGSLYAEDGYDQFLIDNLNITAQNVVSIENTILPGKLSLYPNPADTYVDLVTPFRIPSAVPVVFDRAGKAIHAPWSRSASDRMRIHTGLLPSGMYFITFPDHPGLKPAPLIVTH